MAEEQELVDNLVQLVEQEILSKMILPNMTYDTLPIGRRYNKQKTFYSPCNLPSVTLLRKHELKHETP